MALSVSVSLSAKTETTITMKWAANTTIVQVKYRYKASGGSYGSWTTKTVSAKSGTFKISSLSANTSYTIEYDIRSSSEGVSGTTTAKTYNWPYAKSAPTFSAYNGALTINLTNPLERSCTVKIKYGSTVVETETDVTVGVDWGAGYFEQSLLPLIPNSYSGTYTVEVIYSGHTMTKTGTFTSEGANPTITFAAYTDTNSTAQAIIQDTTKLLQNISTPQFLVSGTALYDATIASADVVILNSTYSGTASGSNVTVPCSTVNSATNVNALVVLYDSRGNSAGTTVTLTMIGYDSPSAIIDLARKNNYYSETDLTVDASVAQIGSNAPTITAKYRESGTSTWYNWDGQSTLTDNTEYTQSLDNTKEWDVQIVVTDTFGGSTTYNDSVGVGLPIMFIDRILRSVGLNVFPDTEGELATKPIVAGDLSGSTSISDKSLTSGTTPQNIGSFELTKGIWEVKVFCRFASNSTGRRYINIADSSAGTDGDDWNKASRAATDGTYTYMHLHTWLTVTTATKTFYINGYQNSGSSLAVRTRWGARKIGHV